MVVRVLPDVPAIDKAFDYLVPDHLAGDVRVGTIVRIDLHGRRVRGWVVADGVTPPPGVALRAVAKVTGCGPPPELVELAGWAAWRWAGPVSALLRTASPPVAVRGLPRRTPSEEQPAAPPGGSDELVDEALAGGRTVVRLPPAADPFPFVAAAAARGDALVVAPSVADAARVALRLRRSGRAAALVPKDWAMAAAGGCTVVGARAGAWAPVPKLSSVVVLDAHDQAHHEERAPTWSAWQVAAERAERVGAPCALLSPCPTLELLAGSALLLPTRAAERTGWPAVVVVDRRRDDPRSGLYSKRLVALLRSGRRVVCVLNRKGRARLLACAACGELARCVRCQAAVEQVGSGLSCRRCRAERPLVCPFCGAQRHRVLRAGVARVREELEALAGEPVAELTGDSHELPGTAVVVGTEAALHRLPSADAVAFLDFDQELLAPRFRAGEHALALLARAARLVGGRAGHWPAGGGTILVQTRLPGHEVLEAAVGADPGRLAAAERPRRAELRLPPEAALALVSGGEAAAFVAGLPSSVEVLGSGEGRWLVRGPDHRALCDALASVRRPAGRLRVEVDPVRV